MSYDSERIVRICLGGLIGVLGITTCSIVSDSHKEARENLVRNAERLAAGDDRVLDSNEKFKLYRDLGVREILDERDFYSLKPGFFGDVELHKNLTPYASIPIEAFENYASEHRGEENDF